VSVRPDGMAYAAQEDVDGLPAVIEFDPGSIVLTTFGRINAGTIRGDRAVAGRVPELVLQDLVEGVWGRPPPMRKMDLDAIEATRERLRAQYVADPASRPPSTARGIHHTALLSSDVARTIGFYQGILEFPLTELFENRDYEGSTHFFFDLGNGNAIAFFDFPELGLGDYAEVLGGLHHLAISVPPDRWEHLRANLEAEGVEVLNIDSSLYFRDPDGARIELISDPLGEMYGNTVL